VPYTIHTVLTDNGTHFTSPGNTCSAAAEIRRAMDQGEQFWVTPSNTPVPRTASITASPNRVIH